MSRALPQRKLSVQLLESRRLLASGDLDLAFGMAGKVLDAPTVQAFDVAFQEDGKVVVAGAQDNDGDFDFVLLRYKADGSPDFDFGASGRVVGDFDPSIQEDSGATAVTVQADGKIVIAGSIGVARFHGDGTPDSSFAGSGTLLVPEFLSDNVKDVVVQPNGKIVVLCANSLYRFNANGALDPTFSEDGIAPLPIASPNFPNQSGSSVALQDDGRIVVGGAVHNTSRFGAWRFNADGTPDVTFDGDGVVNTRIPFGGPGSSVSVARANDVLIQPDGKIVLAGARTRPNPQFFGDFVLVRYSTDGSLDGSFGINGIAARPFRSSLGDHLQDEAFAAALQGDGKIVVAGHADFQSYVEARPSKFGVMRFNANGTLDTSFSIDGKVMIDFQAEDRALGVAVDEGKIVLGGISRDNNLSGPDNFGVASVALARLDASARPEDLVLGDNVIPENRPAGTVVGGFTTVDDDSGDTFTYTLTAGPGAANNGAFEIVGNQLRTRFPFNFEHKSSYTVRVRTTDAFGNFRSEPFTIQVADVAEPLTLGGISGSIGYTLNGPSIWLSQSATLSDDGSTAYNGGRLLVEVTSGIDSDNRLLFGGAFSLQGDNVVRNGVVIGQQTSNGVGAAALEITFNANALRAVVEQLARSVRFRTVASASTEPRSISFTVEDGSGELSNTAVKTVNVTA